MTKKKPDTQQKLVNAALRLAATQDWSQLTLDQIARTAKVPATTAQKLFSQANDLLNAIVCHVDDEVSATIGKTLSQGTARDRLFEVMMARFDVLQIHRPAFLSIIAAVKRDPSLARILLPAQTKAMQKMLALAGVEVEGPKQLLATAGLLVVYGASLHSWERDESRDMSKTMAALDRHLNRANKLAEILFRAF